MLSLIGLHVKYERAPMCELMEVYSKKRNTCYLICFYKDFKVVYFEDLEISWSSVQIQKASLCFRSMIDRELRHKVISRLVVGIPFFGLLLVHCLSPSGQSPRTQSMLRSVFHFCALWRGLPLEVEGERKDLLFVTLVSAGEGQLMINSHPFGLIHHNGLRTLNRLLHIKSFLGFHSVAFFCAISLSSSSVICIMSRWNNKLCRCSPTEYFLSMSVRTIFVRRETHSLPERLALQTKMLLLAFDVEKREKRIEPWAEGSTWEFEVFFPQSFVRNTDGSLTAQLRQLMRQAYEHEAR